MNRKDKVNVSAISVTGQCKRRRGCIKFSMAAGDFFAGCGEEVEVGAVNYCEK
jgi:UPF0288 family protein (methanogenesis marker protein 3)